jgi:TolA-binding protein
MTLQGKVQGNVLLVILGLAALAGLVYLGVTELPSLISSGQNQELRQQMAQMEQLVRELQAAISQADGARQTKLAGQIQQLQQELAQTRQELAALRQAPSQPQQPEPEKPAQQPAPTQTELAKAKAEGRTEGAAVALAIAGGIWLLCQITDCAGQAAGIGQQPPERPTPVAKQSRPPQIYSDAQCAQWAQAPQSQEEVSFTAKMPNPGKLVVTADTRWGRGFFRCIVFLMSPQAQERFSGLWPGQNLPGALYARCYQYANRSECVFRTEILQLYDRAWLFGLDSFGKLHWSSQELQVARFN